MGLYTGRGVLDPRYFSHPRPSFEGDYVALVEFFDPSDSDDDVSWDEVEEKWVSVIKSPLWRGMARVVPNKDWRARTKDFAGESNAEHAVRVQLDIRKNLLVPKAQWTQENAVDLKTNHMMRVITNPADQLLTEYRFVVRNSVGASDNWHRTILCDVNLGGRFSG